MYSFGPPARYFELLSALLVIGHEELFQLRESRLADVINRFDAFVVIRVNCHTEKPVVGFLLSILDLLVRNDAAEPHFYQAAEYLSTEA
jgi:hypothetical protein